MADLKTIFKNLLKKVEYTEDIDYDKIPDDLETLLATHIDEHLIFRSIAHEDDDISKKAVGKRMGHLETEQKRFWKETGEELGETIFETGDYKDKTFEEIRDEGSKKLAEKIKTLKESSNKSDDKQIETLTKKIEDKGKEFTSLQESYEVLTGEKEKVVKDFDEYKTNGKLTNLIATERDKVKLSDKANDLWKRGFYSQIDDEVKVEIDAESPHGHKLINISDNKPIFNGSELKSYSQHVEEKAKAAEMLALKDLKETPKPVEIVKPNEGDKPRSTVLQSRLDKANKHLDNLKEATAK